MEFTINVNGETHTVDVENDTPLLWVLRDVLDLTGTKFGCGMALCGACTVHADGVPVRSCMLPIQNLGSKRITTIEAIGDTAMGRKVQEAWLALDVPQCGYCQGGQILSAVVLLTNNGSPSDEDIDAAMAGNICRCGTYTRIRAAIQTIARGLKSGEQ